MRSRAYEISHYVISPRVLLLSLGIVIFSEACSQTPSLYILSLGRQTKFNMFANQQITTFMFLTKIRNKDKQFPLPSNNFFPHLYVTRPSRIKCFRTFLVKWGSEVGAFLSLWRHDEHWCGVRSSSVLRRLAAYAGTCAFSWATSL